MVHVKTANSWLQRFLNKGFTFHSSTGMLIENLFKSRGKHPEGGGGKEFHTRVAKWERKSSHFSLLPEDTLKGA